MIEVLYNYGWNILKGNSQEIPAALTNRYPVLPEALQRFLTKYAMCENAQKTKWFVTCHVVSEESKDAFRWNEFELMSIESAEDDKDEIDRIKSFWDSHIPFFMSVEDGYEYYAVSVENATFGKIVHGVEADFEDATIVAKDIGQFIEKFRVLEII
ncbi:SMI1/KNR4 family protein [Aliiglaciecola sp. M165]|uniref:SMI1/KNR4 family protein n=1 Tax=Aliiglaciecola sp. M165 TaxID=2593649 RepID=UPI001180601F|nr:SMI1/KNR4 family protein [Aliiglaciecola sp. M165]TRY30145.1 SMI1/KNR4 family protein [Aliiglaciecola sp. M165]